MKIIIEGLQNGWTVAVDDGENYSSDVGFTYDADETDKAAEVAKFASMLSYITDTIGPTTSRYDKERIYITIAPGDKHEDYTEN